MSSTVDTSFHPHATAIALDTVNEHLAAGPELVFYSGWFCPFVQRVWIALELKEIEYQYREENPYHKDKDFLQVSPKGLVPALKYRGEPIHESLVILEFLEDAYPSKRPLFPPDPYARARVRLAIDHISKVVVPAFYQLLQAQDAHDQEIARDKLVAGLKKFASDMDSRGPWWAGEQLTYADVVLLPHVARFFILEEERTFDTASVGPEFKEYCDQLLALPEFKRTCSDPVQLKKSYARYLKDLSQSEVAKATRSGGDLP